DISVRRALVQAGAATRRGRIMPPAACVRADVPPPWPSPASLRYAGEGTRHSSNALLFELLPRCAGISNSIERNNVANGYIARPMRLHPHAANGYRSPASAVSI